jgi:tetratricopeptide (TPR) repeat protein/serine/threonine protein kinase
MATADGDRNLLFGTLALQMDFISRDAFVKARESCGADKTKTIGKVLVEEGALNADRCALLESLVDEHIEQHGGEAGKSLAALSSAPSVYQTLYQTPAEQEEGIVHTLKQDGGPEVKSGFLSGAGAQPAVGAPSTVGLRFRILRPHAEGGLGKVSVARDEELHRDVALKEIKERHADNYESRARFLVEAEITGALEHPGVVPVYGLGRYADGRPFYAMRFIKGDTLREAVEHFHKAEANERPAGRRLELRKLLGRFVDICDVIAYAHSRGILHRDLKPDNIMLGKYGETLVVDWGLAKPLGAPEEAKDRSEPLFQPSGDGSAETQMGAAIGTPQYMPPEQAAGRLDVLGPASDVYSLGATLYCVLTGQSPFPDPTVGEVLQKVQRGEFPPPRQVNPKTPTALEAVCVKAMALRPEDRYPTARILAHDIEQWLADEPVSAWREPWRVRVGRWMRHHQKLAAATVAGLLVAILAGGAGALWYQHEQAAQAARHAAQASATASGVDAALNEAEGLEKQAAGLKDEPVRWKETLSEAGSAVKRAEGLLNSGEGADDLRIRLADAKDRLEAAEKDRRLLAHLEEVHLQSAVAGSEGGFDLAGEAKQYAAAFEEDMRFSELNTEEAAERINSRPIRVELLAALADWSNAAPDKEDKQRLRDVLKAADPDPATFRNRWNAAMTKKDEEALHNLAFSPEARNQPAVRVALLGWQLTSINAADAVKFLKDANDRRPGDFWILFRLGHACRRTTPPLTDDAIRYFTAALALRPDSSTAHIALANELRIKRQFDDAIREYRFAARLKPDNVWAYNGLGLVLRDQGNRDEAILEYRKAIELDPKLSLPHTNLGLVLQDQHKLDEAAVEHRKAVELDPKSVYTHASLGNLLREQSKREEGEAEYRQALELDPKYASGHNGLAIVLNEEGKRDEAVAEYQKAIELQPKYVAAHSNLGGVLHSQHKWDEAVAEYRKALEFDAKYVFAHTGLGNVLRDQGKRDEALAEYRKAVELDPKYAYAHNGLGNALYDQGKRDEAATEYRKAVELDPRNASAHSNLAGVLRDQHRPDEAVAEFQKAIELDPKYINAHNNLGNVLREQGKWDEAAVEYRKALEIDPKYAVAHNGLGNVLREQGKREEATAEYRQASEFDPKLAGSHNTFGITLYNQGKLDEAAAEYRNAFELDPKMAAPHSNLGNVLADQGKREEAIAEYRKAVELDPNITQAHNGLGNVLSALGKREEAAAEYRKAIEIDSRFALAHNGLGNVLRDMGKREEATAEYRKAVAFDPKFAIANANLGTVLHDQRKLDEAAAAFRKAVQLDSKYVYAHNQLGNVLREQGKWDEAAAEYRRAIELDPKYVYAHNGLALILDGKGQREEAAVEYRRAAALDPKLAAAHNAFGNALYNQAKWDEAAAEFRNAIELDPKYVLPHFNLGNILTRQVKLEEAVAEYRQALELVDTLPAADPLRESIPQLLHQTEGMAAVEKKLPAVLKGETKPADAAEQVSLGRLCYLKKLYADAARFYADAFTAQPTLADDLPAYHRYNAACAAVLAAAGKGEDGDKMDDKERARLRQQALGWLRADLALWAKREASGAPAARAVVQAKLRHWQEDPDLAGVRDAAALDKMPEAERAEWKKLWAEAEELLKKSGESGKK